MPTFVTPEPEATHYGIPVTAVGEDGDVLALGHHEPRRALAAFNRHAREQVGLLNLTDIRSSTAAECLAYITQGWALFRKPLLDDDSEDPDWEWVMVPCAATDENAIPITLYCA